MTRTTPHIACAALLLLLTLTAASGCYDTSRCGRETCNGRDDDCDGRADEGFVDAKGRYSGVANCGACGLSCADVFPSASQTACVVDDSGAGSSVPRCEIRACPEGSVQTAGACVPETRVDCLPCERDEDCGQDASCLPDERGELHCLHTCDA